MILSEVIIEVILCMIQFLTYSAGEITHPSLNFPKTKFPFGAFPVDLLAPSINLQWVLVVPCDIFCMFLYDPTYFIRVGYPTQFRT